MTAEGPKAEPHRITVRVYYEDTDFSGRVYHASYLRFLERARTELLRDLGIHQGALHEAQDAYVFVVRRMEIEWLKPALMDDLLVVETVSASHRGPLLTLDQTIIRDGVVLLTASVLVVTIKEGKPARLPPELARLFAPVGA
jgi:acyl-CoA thioester hydrolase